MVRPFTELEKYYDLALMLEWTEESEKTIDAITKLVRQQLALLSGNLRAWRFGSYCLSAGGGVQKNSVAIALCIVYVQIAEL